MREDLRILRLSLLVFSSLMLISCSSAKKKTQEANSKAPDSKALVMATGDAEVEEIDEISQLPKTNRDYQNAEDLAQIPIEINSLVVKWIDYFQGRGRLHMERYLARSSRYLPIMKKILKERGMPEDLVYVALIESGFSPTALSRVGAVGYWQFMRGTGRDYGLKINSLIDERRDPVLSTQAAADYFSGLYNLFGSWYLAIASYNAGENKIKRLIMTHHTRDFWELIGKGRMPVETINYVPKFLAASLIAKNPGKYGFDNINYATPFAYDEIKIDGTISLRRLATKMNLDYVELKALNPGYKTDYAMSSRGGDFVLRVPVGRADDAGRMIAEARVRDTRVILAAGRTAEGPVYSHYKIRKGDSLTEIANRYNVTIAELAKTNKLSPRANLLVGHNILVPQKGSVSRRVAEYQVERKSKKSKVSEFQKSKDSATIHVVKRGDTLAGIARKYRVSMREIAGANNMRARSRILVGSRIQIPN